MFHLADGVAAKLAIRTFVSNRRGDGHVAFKDNLRCRWNFQVDRLASHQFHRLTPQRAGDCELVDVNSRYKLGGQKNHRVSADSDSNLQLLLASKLRPFVVFIRMMAGAKSQESLILAREHHPIDP